MHVYSHVLDQQTQVGITHSAPEPHFLCRVGMPGSLALPGTLPNKLWMNIPVTELTMIPLWD